MAATDRVACLCEAASSSGGSGASAEDALARSGRFTESYEWRISTTTDRGIEKTAAGYRAWSTTDGTWEAHIALERDALAAMSVLASLQHSMFYAMGWPSSAAGTTREGGRSEGRWSHAPGNPCERYLADSWLAHESTAAAHAQEAARLVAETGEWQTGGLRIRPTAPLRIDYDTGQPEGPDWYETDVTAPGLRFVSASPTCRRALELGLIYGRLATDLADVLGWQLVSA